MERLKIETYRRGMGVNTMRVCGFTKQELKELGSMEHGEMTDTVLNMLDERNGNTGTCWQCGNGVYRMWIDADAVFVEIGSSCD